MTYKWREFQNNILEIFYESKEIARIYGVPYNPQHQWAVRVFNRTVQNFYILSKDHKKIKYNLEESCNDLMI